MSRGSRGSGRGRGRGGRRTGPDLSYDDEPVNLSGEPEALFPSTRQVAPKSLSSSELNRVDHYRRFRNTVREGSLYTILEPSNLTDEHGKVNKRAGFDPFESMPTYSSRYKKPKRTVPDLSTRPYVLKFLPKELWSTLDPQRKNPEWETLGPLLPGSQISEGKTKRKRLEYVEGEEDKEDVVVMGGRRKRHINRDDPTKRTGQKQGLEAEDQYGPEVEEVEEDADGAEEALQDSDFEESDDGAGDDYNAENYFEGGGDEDYGEDDGGGDEGVNFP